METKHKKTNPYLEANCLSRLFYSWVDSIIKQGCSRQIELEDIYDVLPQDSSDFLCFKLENHWKNELRSSGQGSPPSLLKAIARSFGPYVFLWSIVFFFEEVVKIICPFMIGGLIRHFMHDSQDILGASMYALGICICAIIPTIIHHPYFLALLESGMRMRLACCALIYKKMMKLDIFSCEKVAIGHVINLMSNDVARFDLAIGMLPYLIVGPLEMLVVSIILWFYIGWSGVIGMLLLLPVIPIMGALAKLFSRLRSEITVLSGKRLSLMAEVLNNIQLIKMCCLESYIEGVILKTRRAEVKKLYKAGYARGFTLSTNFFSVKLAIFATFLTYVLMGNIITAEVVFVTMSLYNPVKLSLTNCFPVAMQFTAEMLVTIRKIQEFLLLEERHDSITWDDKNNNNNKNNMANSKHLQATNYLKSVNLGITWNPDKKPIITNLSFDVRGSDLLVVVGAVGSGKTSLLLTIMKELPFLEGEMNVSGSVAYVPQSPWIFNSSVKNNIVMGSIYDAQLYRNVIKFSALDKDLEQLPNGDETIVGERGMSLSGGQKARVGLARAMYRDAGIYLLDAPLSAVDASVGHFLFHKCINGFLSKKLRVLVTHQLQYLSHASKILLIDKNQQHVFGSLQEMVAMGVDFVKIFKDSSDLNIKKQSGDVSQAAMEFSSSKSISRSLGYLRKEGTSWELQEMLSSKSSGDVGKTSNGSLNLWNSQILDGSTLNVPETTDQHNCLHSKQEKFEKQKSPEESMSVSTISLKLYANYFISGGGILPCACCLLLNILAQTSFLVTDWWLAYWCQSVETFMKAHNSSSSNLCSPNSSCPPPYLLSNETHQIDEPIFPHTNFYLAIFSLLSILVVVLGVMRAIQFFHMAISSSNNLHTNMLYAILRSPMTFFVDVPAGQILNRFSKDLGQIDDYLPLLMFDLMQSLLLVLGVFVVISVSNPLVILAIIPTMVCFMIMRNYFLKSFRNIKRLEAITKSPVFSHVSITFNGLHTIRCHGDEYFFIKEFHNLQDNNTAAFSLFLFLSRWFAVRLEWLCTILICVVAFSCLIVHQFSNGTLIGLSLAYVMTLLVLFQWVVRQSTDVQGMMVLVERIHEYSKLPIEDVTSSNIPQNWPENGRVEFKEVTLRYKALDALHQVTFTVTPGEKIGIVGRTGAGKSSLINVLFRLFDFNGKVFIDGVDHCSINLHHLRKNLSIIPQDPILFAGPLRNNLDPLSRHSDQQLWHAIKKVEMDETIRDMKEGLYFTVREGGTNLSVGQRQLLCMARALLEDNKILVIDEATSNVDRHTDKLIQKKLREEFVNCTVLTIAHRLSTIIDYNKIMVLEAGEIKDCGIPHVLLQNKDGAFYKMAFQSGEEEFKSLVEAAAKNYKAMEN